MAIDRLETFEVDPEAPITPQLAWQGTNANRYAIAGALSARGTDGVMRPVRREDLETFGFSDELWSTAQDTSFGSDQAVLNEVAFLRECFGYWIENAAREHAWEELNSGNLASRLTLLSGGMCSPLERESVTAAVALIGVLRDGPDLRDTLHVPWDLRLLSSLRNLAGWGESWTRPLDPTVGPSSDADTAVSLGSWEGDLWEAQSNAVIEVALEDTTSDSSLLNLLAVVARTRIEQGMRSSDGVTRELSSSVWLQGSKDIDGATRGGNRGGQQSLGGARTLSTMIHGTWGWKGDWWYPGGGFHTYVKDNHRPQLCSDGREFSWSGGYSEKQRATAGHRFQRWVDGASTAGRLGTVFAHSYGGEVAARTVNLGASIDEVVLLSAPVNHHHRDALDRVHRVIDVRLKSDIVLRLAREGQRLPHHSAVTEFIVKGHFWQHGATHVKELWEDQAIAQAVNL